MTHTKLELSQTAEFIQQHLVQPPEIGLILGSGLGVLADEIENPVKLPYEDIHNFPVSTVEGHAGQLVAGTIAGKQVIAMQGRFHFYEGYTMEEVVFPVRVMKQLGVKQLIVTNAAGAVNESFSVGDLMIIKDHINNQSANPLIGPNDASLGLRFTDMSNAYSKRLRDIALNKAKELQVSIQEGTYVANTGPCYETPAEVKMARMLGGDAVGMSTVPEVIAARHAGLEVLGISCLSNMGAGILPQPLNHEEVIEVTEKVRASFLGLVKAIIKEM
ncbi:purine-nucleoside phosphorylase [Alkalicoccobacillus porphyridii]|uniref:Purine nucleoside phosphorylase n=1 Tax=Alkalicoccobacillus porphyridii TaxID=2597270 RepID=A0A553ZYP7_9BACI|nr:purine-nucleoside phosphorylase [Alkalicoccobacillus porphyridii]TSB46569.1 purine-nucleoside phosphorylase [Alkalicoccobacillus porphyridii]